MELTNEQMEALPFPKGCPVWYNFPDKSSSETMLLKQVSLCWVYFINLHSNI